MTAPARRGYVLEELTDDSALGQLDADWLDLFARSGTRNPFAHPAWVRAWYRNLAPGAHERLFLAIRRSGELVAVAPFVQRTFGRGPLKATSLTLIGKAGSRFDRLSELTEVLVLPAERRGALQALIQHLTTERAGSWDWLTLTLPPNQGWINPEWVSDSWQRLGVRPHQKTSLNFVVMPLPHRWEDVPLKRNMKEAIRRSRNRLAATGEATEIVFVEGEQAAGAIAEIQELHRQRAALDSHRAHTDFFADRASGRFAAEAAGALAATGNAVAAQLRLNGHPIAGRVLLSANDGLFLSFSGADPDYWHLGASTGLMVACIQRGIANGSRQLNLSVAPDSAKLRWSEQVETHSEFVLVAPTRHARRSFALYWLRREHRALSRGKTAPPGETAV